MLIDLDITDADVLIVGGGRVAARRVAALIDAGARPTIVAPTLHPALRDAVAAGRARHEARRWLAGESLPPGRWAVVVVAVDDPALDRALVAQAKAAAVPVSSALGGGSVRHPAVRRHGCLSLAVDTGAAAPGLAAALADRLLATLAQWLPEETLARWDAEGWPRGAEALRAAIASIEVRP